VEGCARTSSIDYLDLAYLKVYPSCSAGRAQ
jgi:hypothetical protein